MHLIEVAFKGNRKEFYAWEGESPPPVRAAIVVEADRGEDLGLVHAVGDLASKRSTGCAHGCGSAPPARKALRVASAREMHQSRDLRAQDDVARVKATERVKAHGLVMKLSDAEWQWDRKKLTFYFTAEKRVDFRNLVRDLASLFRARIELKQIGVRDEAKRLDGVGRCGRQYCSASWLPELRPVNLGVAKDQHLSLNPSQISGACGRLMCCLRYEHEFYVQSRKRFPKEGKTVVTAAGEEKVVANDIFNERVTLRKVDGETRVVPLAELRRELEAVGSGLAGGVGTVAAPNGAADDTVTGDDRADGAATGFGAEDDVRALAVLDEERDESGVAIAAEVEYIPEDQRRDAVGGQPEPATGTEGSPQSGDSGHRRRGRRGGRRGRGRGGPSGSGGGAGNEGGSGSGGRGGSSSGGPTSAEPS